MSMNINTENQFGNQSRHEANRNVLFDLGFRIFFLSAGLFSIIAMCAWLAVYLLQFSLPLSTISPNQWHAHEMVYGYGLAVIAGFLLTAVKNWTGVQTLRGKPLMLLFSCWAAARITFLFGAEQLAFAGLFDILFALGLVTAIAYPIVKARQWKQIAIVSKIALLALCNVLFYLGALNMIDAGINWGIYGGLYLIIGLILNIGRRVLPFFIEKGVGYEVKLFNSKWIDISSLVLFLGFTIVELFFHSQAYSSYLALALFMLTTTRLIGWHTPGIWRKSLLWSLYLAFWFINLGFALFASVHFFGIEKYPAIHAFAVGGVGVMTLAMMSRVSLGHSGRGIQNPPKAVAYAVAILLTGAMFRVIGPLLAAQHYLLWIGLSQVLWIVAFTIFSVVYYPILSKPRIDGQPG